MGNRESHFGDRCDAGAYDERGPAALQGQGWTVALRDPIHERRARIAGLIKEMGCHIRLISDDAFDERQLEGCAPIALVRLGDVLARESRQLRWISSCKAAGSIIIAYEDGVSEWSVRSKCFPLLAGAGHLLDSSDDRFAFELRRLLEQVFQTLTGMDQEQQAIRTLMSEHGIIGDSPAMISVFTSAVRFSQLSDLPVLITGDSGTGKELLARAISRMDAKRKNGPLVTINCAAITPTLMEGEFFGHRRGSFTGAERDRRGLIRAAEHGVLFLDEIGELEMGLQGKLLRVLQENRLLGVGEEREVSVDVRFIAATNRNLEQLVAEQKFRADLFHRLRVLRIHMPSLSERSADLLSLVEHFLKKHQKIGTGSVLGVSRDFLQALQEVDLSGNVRQLENLIRQCLMNHHRAGDLDLHDLPGDVLREITGPSAEQPSMAACLCERPPETGELSQREMNALVKQILDNHKWNLCSTLRDWERQVFQAALNRAQGNQSEAARLLGVTPRSVYNKVRKYHLSS